MVTKVEAGGSFGIKDRRVFFKAPLVERKLKRHGSAAHLCIDDPKCTYRSQVLLENSGYEVLEATEVMKM